jgi:hypothetical protein
MVEKKSSYLCREKKIHAKSIITARLPSVHSFHLPYQERGNGIALRLWAANFILSHELLSVTTVCFT